MLIVSAFFDYGSQLEENQNKIKAQNSELQQSVQTNSYSITDLLERIAISSDGLDL